MCDYDPDSKFRRFKLVEFPTSFVGLATHLELDLEHNATGPCFLRTTYQGVLMTFEEAREVSPAHRAYTISYIDNQTLNIVFKPTNECISRAIQIQKQSTNRFVFDLRLIKSDGYRCCNDLNHCEIGRYYVSGRYDYCKTNYSPKIVDFGEVAMMTKVVRTVRIRNDSKYTGTKILSFKAPGFVVVPEMFLLLPNSSRKVTVTFKPTCMKVANNLEFLIRNLHDEFNKDDISDTNFIKCLIPVKANVIYNIEPNKANVVSLHSIWERNPKNAYLGKELTMHKNGKELAKKFFEYSKVNCVKKTIKEKFAVKLDCYNEQTKDPGPRRRYFNFCEIIVPKISAPDLFEVLIIPNIVKFGKVGIKTYGYQTITIQNRTKFNVSIEFLQNKVIYYTKRKYSNYTIKVKANSQSSFKIACFGNSIGIQKGSFTYLVENQFYRKHTFELDVDNPIISVSDTQLKFGMITSESFVTSVPLKLYNNYNVPITFQWMDLPTDAPFEILPMFGVVVENGCSICDITFTLNIPKTKTYEFTLITRSSIRRMMTIEATILTRKLSVKFLQNIVIFKDIPLNLEVYEEVRLENSSREVATFYVIEPLLPGLSVEPMHGVMRPKSIITFSLRVQISCCLEFIYDLFVKINNKENVGVLLTGSVFEPKLNVSPRNIFMPRIACGLVTFVPVNFQNTGQVKSIIEILDVEDDNIFEIYCQNGNEKEKISAFILEPGRLKTVYVKVYDSFRREYEQYVPFRVNHLLGPPNENSMSTEFGYYIGEYESKYLSSPKVKVRLLTKDINYVRITGVFTVPWIEFSEDKFELNFDPEGDNKIKFIMKNVSKYTFPVYINTSKLSPHFSLEADFDKLLSKVIVADSCIKFELEPSAHLDLKVRFHPQAYGKFVHVAPFYLDKSQSVAYYNLTFIGRRKFPNMRASIYRFIFPPVLVNTELSDTFNLEYEDSSDINQFSFSAKEIQCLSVDFYSHKIVKRNEKTVSIVGVRIKVRSDQPITRNLGLIFSHELGSKCSVDVVFCFTYCPVTLHVNAEVPLAENPYPFFPTESQAIAYEYYSTCVNFMERWLFLQGFRRDLYPEIPQACHAIAIQMVTPSSAKVKGISVSILNYMRRVAGPLMKHVRKAVPDLDLDESIRPIKEIHDTYRSIIQLLRSRGAHLPILQAKHLLSYEQFAIYNDIEPSKYDSDKLFTDSLIEDPILFHNFTKQCWFDLFLQSYKVFVLDSCFFECVCVSKNPRNIVDILVNWYNEQTKAAHERLFDNDEPPKIIRNLTTDLQDGIAIISAIYNHCPFVGPKLFMIRGPDKDKDDFENIIHNACIITEVLHYLKLYFPLTSKDFLQPNYLQMLFLTVHLYIILPTFRPKSVIHFNPPLLRSSTRTLTINPTTQESVLFNYVILSNKRNSFSVEKVPLAENGKKIQISVKYEANFITNQSALLLIYGYNKTRVFDTYITFELVGSTGFLNPLRKCKVTASIYRPMKVDISVHSPFPVTCIFKMYLTDSEPTIPFVLNETPKRGFYVRQLTLIEDEITLIGHSLESNPGDVIEHKVYFQMCCLNTQIQAFYLWFRSEYGEFFVKLTTQPRWDLPLETQQVNVFSWPMQPCSCGEACECYRSTIIKIPHRNEYMLKSLRFALSENATEAMMAIYDRLIESETGQVVIMMLLVEGGTSPSEVAHILRPENTYHIYSRNLMPRLEQVTLQQHTDNILALPVTIPPNDDAEKYTITFTSTCDMDVRTFRIVFIAQDDDAITDTT